MLEKIQIEKEQIRRLVLLFLLGTWLLRAWLGLLLFQLHDAPFIAVQADNTFWLHYATQIPYYCIHYQFIGGLMDFLWLGATMFCLIRPYKLIAFVVLNFSFFNYFIIYNAVATHHEHTLVALLFLLILISIDNNKNFVLSFVGLRYYVVFVFFSAAMWKLCRGSLFHPNQMSELLKIQHIDYLLDYPDAYFSQFIRYTIEHSYLSAFFWYNGWLLEAIFVLGFITRKYDKLLFLLFLMFFAMDYLLMNLCFVEFCIFVLVFYPWKEIWSYYEHLSLSSKGT